MKTRILRIYLTVLILAMTVGTAFAQDGSADGTGPTLMVLLMGLAAVGGIGFFSWIQSAPDDSDE